MKEKRRISKPFDILGFRAAYVDIKNYREWIETIKMESENPHSIYRKFNMGHNFFYNIFVIVTLNGEDAVLPEGIQRLRVTEALIPINRYLDEELKFAEYLTPEFSRVYQGQDPTLSFLIVYAFTFQKLSIKWVISRLLILSGLTFGLIKFPWKETIQWISNLI